MKAIVLLFVFSFCFYAFALAPAVAQMRQSFDHQRWVDWESQTQANQNRMRHIQKCPAGYRAGVGWSTRSPADAVRNCCYWGAPSSARWFAVRKGSRGWYAAALYK